MGLGLDASRELNDRGKYIDGSFQIDEYRSWIRNNRAATNALATRLARAIAGRLAFGAGSQRPLGVLVVTQRTVRRDTLPLRRPVRQATNRAGEHRRDKSECEKA